MMGPRKSDIVVQIPMILNRSQRVSFYLRTTGVGKVILLELSNNTQFIVCDLHQSYHYEELQCKVYTLGDHNTFCYWLFCAQVKLT